MTLLMKSHNLERTLINQKSFLRKSAIFPPIKLPFIAEAAEKFLNVIYYTYIHAYMTLHIQYMRTIC